MAAKKQTAPEDMPPKTKRKYLPVLEDSETPQNEAQESEEAEEAKKPEKKARAFSVGSEAPKNDTEEGGEGAKNAEKKARAFSAGSKGTKFDAKAWAEKIMEESKEETDSQEENSQEAAGQDEPGEKPKSRPKKKEPKKGKTFQGGETLSYGGETCVGATQLAQVFGVTARRIHQLTQDGTIHPKARGQYDVDTTVREYIQYLSNKAYGKGKSDTEMELKAQKIKAEIALKETQTELHRMKMDLAQGNYIGRDEIELDYRKFFVVFKRFALSIPPRLIGMLAGQVDPAELRKTEHDLAEEVKKVLNTFVVAGTEEDGKTEKDPD